MFEVGFTEIVLILGLALIVLGPEKLPGLAAKVGRWTGRARSMARQLRTQLEHEVTLEELAKSKPMQAPAQHTPPPGASYIDPLEGVDTSPEAMHGQRAAEPTASSEPADAATQATAAGRPETDPTPIESSETTPETVHGTSHNKAPS